MRNHPLLAEPDVFTALDGGAVSLALESPAGVHVRGGRADQTSYELDGVPLLIPYHAAGLFSVLNPDALSGVRLTRGANRLPGALSGVVAADSKRPGLVVQTRASLSTTQTRLTVDGPLGTEDWGFLVGSRTGFPGGVLQREDPSKLRGEAGDWVGKVEGLLAGGMLRVLGFGIEDELSSVAVSDPLATDPSGQIDVRLDL